jgi:hypothetical protein
MIKFWFCSVLHYTYTSAISSLTPNVLHALSTFSSQPTTSTLQTLSLDLPAAPSLTRSFLPKTSLALLTRWTCRSFHTPQLLPSWASRKLSVQAASKDFIRPSVAQSPTTPCRTRRCSPCSVITGLKRWPSCTLKTLAYGRLHTRISSVKSKAGKAIRRN